MPVGKLSERRARSIAAARAGLWSRLHATSDPGTRVYAAAGHLAYAVRHAEAGAGRAAAESAVATLVDAAEGLLERNTRTRPGRPPRRDTRGEGAGVA